MHGDGGATTWPQEVLKHASSVKVCGDGCFASSLHGVGCGKADISATKCEIASPGGSAHHGRGG